MGNISRLMEKLVENLVQGDAFGVNAGPLKFHIVIYVKDISGDPLFFNTTDGSIFLSSYEDVSRAMKHMVQLPNKKIPHLDFIENIPHDVFEVVQVNVESILKDKSPQKLSFFD